jgi:hypothetical protein
MAKVEWITVKSASGGITKPYFNLDHSVGTGGTNSRSDVMVVQALLRYQRFLTNPPQVSGSLDKATEHAIVDFIDLNPFSRIKISDPKGLVRPGFIGGSIEKIAQPKRMIEELNFLVEHIVTTQEPGIQKDGVIRTVLYAYPLLQGTVKGISKDQYGKITVKLPAGGIVDYSHRR